MSFTALQFHAKMYVEVENELPRSLVELTAPTKLCLPT